MSNESLSNWLIGTEYFQLSYSNLLVQSVAEQFGFDGQRRQLDINWNYLLFSASMLAQSDSGSSQSLALRIATYCLESHETGEIARDAAAIILDTMANQPTIDLAVKRSLLVPSYNSRVPLILYQDIARRRFENSITLTNSQSVLVNRFQHKFWDSAESTDWVSVSAPTSSGKSFIIETWLINRLENEGIINVVFIVPSRALIQQVYDDLLEKISLAGLSGKVAISTLPLQSKISVNKSNLFIFTQERLHILLANISVGVSIDTLIVDEAHKLGDGTRGVLLQMAIERVINENQECKLMFASPQTSNPEILLNWAPEHSSTESIAREDVTVNQNLIWLSQVPRKPDKWKMELLSGEGSIELGVGSLESKPSRGKRLAALGARFGNPNGGNVLYVSGASQAEIVSKQLFDYLEEISEDEEDEDIANLIELVKKIIHKDYFLGHVLKKRIAFHYGNMPLIVRAEIERLFGLNKIKHLVCTSTLVEGVNMPCQNLFLRGAKRGVRNDMSPADFWNLAGRAGRWGKEFQGNIICIDPYDDSVWPGGAPRRKEKFQIESTADNWISEEAVLRKFLNDGASFESESYSVEAEYVLSYLTSALIKHGSLASLPWASKYNEEFLVFAEEKISILLSDMAFPLEIIERNPGISPVGISNLYEYFESRTLKREKPVEGLLPLHPQSDDAADSYRLILNRINSNLSDKAFGFSKRINQLTILIIDWMQGKPLAYLISRRESYYSDDPIRNVIRGTMNDVEEFARFRAPKYLACYCDVLTSFLTAVGRNDLVLEIEDLSMRLEFGVSSITQLSLMGLGLSRTSTISVSEFIASDNLDELECLSWLLERGWISRDLPKIVENEISNLLAKHADS